MTSSVTYVTVNGMLFSEVRDGVEIIFVPDTLGSLLECRDSAGSTTYTADYWPFGQLRTSTGSNPSQWGFCRMLGYLTDTAKRRYVRARDLEVKLGRWLEVDPMWPWGSAYAYALETPVVRVDPSGLLPICVPCTDYLKELPEDKGLRDLIDCLRKARREYSSIESCLINFGANISDKALENLKNYIACVMASTTDSALQHPPYDACKPINAKWAFGCCYEKFLQCLFGCATKRGGLLSTCNLKCNKDSKSGIKRCLSDHCLDEGRALYD